jgi:hypothetical protein
LKRNAFFRSYCECPRANRVICREYFFALIVFTENKVG